MTRRRPIPQRDLFFAGCEGACERAYVALLNIVAEMRGLHIWIQGELLNPGAGDPLALVERALDRIAHKRRHRGTSYRHAAVFLDADRAGETRQRSATARQLAAQEGLQLIWQVPNFEAMLLRHLNGCRDLRPPAERSLADLQRQWPDYDKSTISADKLARRIGYPQIVQATEVENELRAFLQRVGLA
jgi:hypothetical protein